MQYLTNLQNTTTGWSGCQKYKRGLKGPHFYGYKSIGCYYELELAFHHGTQEIPNPLIDNSSKDMLTEG